MPRVHSARPASLQAELPPRHSQRERSLLGCSHPAEVSIHPQTGLRHTSSATTTFPPARAHSICVMWPYAGGVTLHPPKESPSAASKPAETSPLSVVILSTRVTRTNDKIWGKLICYGHDDFLKSVDVIAIAKTISRPGYINCPIIHQLKTFGAFAHSLPLTGTHSDHIESAKVARRVKSPTIMPMYRDIQDVWIVPKCSLGPITVVDIPATL